MNTGGNPGNFVAGSLYNDYAARYCYYKNKRNERGQVIENNWYLPAINELMPLTGEIVSMQGKGYWCSSVPTYDETIYNPFEGYPLLSGIWDLLSWLFSSDSGTYYYTKVAKAAKDGEEEKTIYSYGGGLFPEQDVPFYNPRNNIKHVRAVRVAPAQNP